MTEAHFIPRFFALLPAAGQGRRAGPGGPKQYRRVADAPMLRHTVMALSAVRALALTLVVVAPDDTQFDSLGPWPCAVARCGDSTRAGSVQNGLGELVVRHQARAGDWVLVHDAARCLIEPHQINALIDACRDDEVGGLLALPLADTLKVEHEGRVASTLARGDKWLAQTPQMFRVGLLMQALASAGPDVTDEASAVEALGLRPLLVPGSADNLKLTFERDFALADAILRSRA